MGCPGRTSITNINQPHILLSMNLLDFWLKNNFWVAWNRRLFPGFIAPWLYLKIEFLNLRPVAASQGHVCP